MPTSPDPHRIVVNLHLEDMHQFEKLMRGLRYENRFHLSVGTERFVSNLVEYAHRAKTVQLEQNSLFWRARVNDMAANKPLLLDQLGSPPPHLAGHGRLNPSGIPYLYLASNELTAISEVRPWSGAQLTVAKFHTTRPLRLANFSTQPGFAQACPDGSEGAEFTWRELITWLFSAPFDPRDDTAYVPTQYIAERVKASSFDGLAYDSALHEGGYNVALFDPTVAVAVAWRTAKVTSVSVHATLGDIREP